LNGAGVVQAAFTGKETDEESTLQYFGARYMDNNIGRFVSVDPVALVLHDGNKLKEITKGGLQQLLSNPQNLNGYSYAVNNPVIMKDDDGNFAFLIPLAYYAATYVAAYSVPILITAIASAGAYVSTKEFGQAVGYTMEGRNDLAQQHFDNSIMADVAVASGVGGLLYAESITAQQSTKNVKDGVLSKQNTTFPKEIWSKNAPKQVTPGVRSLEQVKYFNGQFEKSNVKYDQFGRQIQRVDFSDHGTPEYHSNPHTHMYDYSHSYMGKINEVRINE